MTVANTTWMTMYDYHDLPIENLMLIRTAIDDCDHCQTSFCDVDFDVMETMGLFPQTAMPMHDVKLTSSIHAPVAAYSGYEDHVQ